MIEGLKTIYAWVHETREVLFKHCESMPVELYTKELPNFGHGSIRNLQLHVFDVYNGWLLQFARQKPRQRPKREDYPNVAAVRQGFAQTDAMVEGFLSEFAYSLDKPLTRPHPSFPDGLTVTPRWLFTHVVTHEFHHKGQITDICRHLGHPTPDTDLIIPEKF